MVYRILVQKAAQCAVHFIEILHSTKGNLKYSTLEWMQKELLHYINSVSAYRTMNNQLITCLTNVLDFIGDLLFISKI